jgi:CDP-paratose 2-epimerase
MKEERTKRRPAGRNGRGLNSAKLASPPRLRKVNGFKRMIAANGHAGSKRNGHPADLVLITGGAGFIGTNVAHRLLEDGKKVLIYDNLSRAGVEQNLEWLQKTHPERLEFQRGDVRDSATLAKAVARASHIFHFAAQVAVTTSLDNPIEDFEVNARGTLNLLEAIRSQPLPPSLVFTSTNKVYGDLADVELRANDGRYEPVDAEVRQHGFGEEQSLAFHSPYGCSKGAACQYVLDYARTFGLRTAVFRMSCIYGPHQFGNEDQGWVAHFLIKAMQGNPITIYGDGHQVRDILFVDDLVNAFLLAQEHIRKISGQAFNIGGGPANTISLLELLELIGELQGDHAQVDFSRWRPADQEYYVSDSRKFAAQTGWSPQVSARQGVTRLYQWLRESGVSAGKANRRPRILAGETVIG